MKRQGLVLRALSYLYVLLGCILIGGPMYLTVANAMKDTQQFTSNFFAPPQSLYLDNFINVIIIFTCYMTMCINHYFTS